MQNFIALGYTDVALASALVLVNAGLSFAFRLGLVLEPVEQDHESNRDKAEVLDFHLTGRLVSMIVVQLDAFSEGRTLAFEKCCQYAIHSL